ncbi:MAG: DUF1540 domain-containing protein [Bacillota bacterium]
MSKIKCVVEECKYNKNQICQAGEIEVRSSGSIKCPLCQDTNFKI